MLDVPCLTLRENTERPCTIEQGTNLLVGTDTEKIVTESLNILNGKRKSGQIPPLWDGPYGAEDCSDYRRKIIVKLARFFEVVLKAPRQNIWHNL